MSSYKEKQLRNHLLQFMKGRTKSFQMRKHDTIAIGRIKPAFLEKQDQHADLTNPRKTRTDEKTQSQCLSSL